MTQDRDKHTRGRSEAEEIRWRMDNTPSCTPSAARASLDYDIFVGRCLVWWIPRHMSFFDHQGVRRWLPLAQEPTVGPLPGGRLVRAGLPPYRDLPANPLLGGGTATWFKEATDEHHPPKYMEHGDSVVIIQADDDVHDVPPDDDTPVPAGPEAKRGRPSPKDLVQAEARRRIDEELDKIPDTLKAWGNEIWEWLGDNHPGVKRGKPGAIERHLSDLFNKAQGRKAQT